MKLDTYSPGAEVRREISHLVSKALENRGVKIRELNVERSIKEYGDFSISLARIAGKIGINPTELTEEVKSIVNTMISSSKYLDKVDSLGNYLNFKVKLESYGNLVYNTFSELKDKYGYVPPITVEKIIVEHTSANPIHPLHIGHLRNSLLGDALVRLLRFRGHDVRSHFYIDDTGLQVAYAAYGYSKVKELMEEDVKPDYFIGLVYSMTNAIVNIIDLKKRIKEIKENSKKVAELNSQLSDWTWISKELRDKNPRLFDALAERINQDDNPLDRIKEINKAYEEGEIWAVRLVREMVNKCLEGFKSTFSKLGIRFDSWDWESELTVWNSGVEKVIKDLSSTGLVYRKNGVLVFAADELAKDHKLREKLNIPHRYEVQPLVLTRSDGTSLYTTRDIAYSVWKLSKADRVINIIAVQQALAQTQIRLALYALGLGDKAGKLIHYSYEVVKTSTGSMSGRKGRYISVDELIEEAIRRSKEELNKRGVLEKTDEIPEKVGIGAIKFFFLSYSPSKILTFDWNKVFNFNENSGPFIQYAYVRAVNIIKKAEKQELTPIFNPHNLGEEERKLIVKIGDFPYVMTMAADALRPDILAEFLNELAMDFNKYYDNVPVIKAPEGVRETRLALIFMVATTLLNGMRVLGIEPPPRM